MVPCSEMWKTALQTIDVWWEMPSIYSGPWMLGSQLLVFGEVCILAEGNTPLKVGLDSSELHPTLFSHVYLLLMWTLQSPCLPLPSQTTFLEPQPRRISSFYTLLLIITFYHSKKKKLMPSLRHLYSRLEIWAVLSYTYRVTLSGKSHEKQSSWCMLLFNTPYLSPF